MKQKNLRLLYIHQAFFSFSEGMLPILIPLFLYKLFGSISSIFVWFFAWNLIYGILFIPVFNLAMRLGKPKYFMVLGMVFYFISLAIFGQTGSGNTMLIIPATIIFALYITCYWPTRHWFFSMNADWQRIGKQVSHLGVISILISFIAPIVAGVVSFAVSFNAAFLLGASTAFLAIIPIVLFHAPPNMERFNLKTIAATLKKPELKTIRPAYFWEGFSYYFISVSWILVFALFIGNVKDLGYLIGITTLITAILTRLTGHWFDQKKRMALLDQLTRLKIITTLLYASVFFYPYLTYVYMIDLLNRFSGTMHQTTVDAYLYGYSSKIHPFAFHLNREVYLTLARFFSTGILAIGFTFLPDKFLWAAIALGAFMLMGWLALKRSDHLLH